MPRRTPSVCVLASGGLDSAVLLRRCLAGGRRVLPLYVRCGFLWERAELSRLRRLLKAMRSPRLLPLAIVDVPLASIYGAHWSLTGSRVPGARSADPAVYLPGRNLLLASHAAVVCARRGIATIALGILRGNPFGDATPRFFSTLSAALRLALGRSFRIVTPLRRLTKAQLIRSARGAPLELTFSCIQPRGLRPCGGCNKCAERRRAFHLARVPDPSPSTR